MTSLNVSPLKRLDCRTTTRERPSPAERCRLLFVFYCPVNLPSTPSLRVPRRLPSIPRASRRDQLPTVSSARGPETAVREHTVHARLHHHHGELLRARLKL